MLQQRVQTKRNKMLKKMLKKVLLQKWIHDGLLERFQIFEGTTYFQTVLVNRGEFSRDGAKRGNRARRYVGGQNGDPAP